MAAITVVCDECGQEVDGLIDCASAPGGEAFIMTGGFYIYDSGVSCDECVHGDSGPESGNATTGTSRDEDLRTDGGVTRQRRRLRRRDADSVRQQAGAGDQGRCPHGNRDCANGGDGDVPCFDCLTGGDPDG